MRIIYTLALLLVMFVAAPGNIFAYSYGDANKEDVAETFKLITAALSSSPADWKAAEAAYETRREEIVKHFGANVDRVLESNIKASDADKTIANYKAMLVMNLERRFTNAEQDVTDYANVKILLAKARATCDTLKPYLSEQLSAADIARLDGDFDTALKALGNPGLFGVGKSEADPAKLKQSLDDITATLKPLFPFDQAGAAGGQNAAAGEGAAGGAGAAGGNAGSTVNPAVTVSVIGGVLIVGIAAVWWARRKGFF
ncbi:hypothetical protein [Paenibacillus beijingensis]|uniref:Uncharacterized protein n=1 Tax=Paenibacillus beijingensis TaxID=1126833 RepID=A0A0D5NHR3_9BACL|nr:hypothetical protein [Paenibacillus beijingensis]AJY74635.1 hypothetical protein VN24_08660 [Paenibacillus beijingensis]